jgi:hypothetical protein
MAGTFGFRSFRRLAFAGLGRRQGLGEEGVITQEEFRSSIGGHLSILRLTFDHCVHGAGSVSDESWTVSVLLAQNATAGNQGLLHRREYLWFPSKIQRDSLFCVNSTPAFHPSGMFGLVAANVGFG